MHYDVLIIGAGPGGIFSAYELITQKPELKVAVFETGNELAKRKCPIDGKKIKSCIGCKVCSIMSGFGGAGAFSERSCKKTCKALEINSGALRFGRSKKTLKSLERFSISLWARWV